MMGLLRWLFFFLSQNVRSAGVYILCMYELSVSDSSTVSHEGALQPIKDTTPRRRPEAGETQNTVHLHNRNLLTSMHELHSKTDERLSWLLVSLLLTECRL